MVDIATLCPGCMAVTGTGATCPECGYGPEQERHPVALPEGTILNERFFVGRVLGKPGGFGITYLAWDTKLEATAAIKEYLPQLLATRKPGDTEITPNSADDRPIYNDGLDEFLNEARTLVRFSHPNIVRVRDFFAENSTAYLVMDYYKGQSLSEYLKKGGRALTQEEAVDIMSPILDGLAVMHEQGFLHRDIKPANIYVTQGNKPILLDFGAARHTLGEETESLTVILSQGFAPFEQYFRRGKQGPWTDVYSCAATLYYAMSGIKPAPALDRESEDELEALHDVNTRVSSAVSAAIMLALSRAPDERPQSATELRDLLAAALADPGRRPHTTSGPRPPGGNRVPLIIFALISLVLLAGLFGLQRAEVPPVALPTAPRPSAALPVEPTEADAAEPSQVELENVVIAPEPEALREPPPHRRDEPYHSGPDAGPDEVGRRPPPRDGRFGARPPPPEAVDACHDASLMSACVFEAPHGTVNGTCGDRHGYLACAPHRRRH